MTRDDRKADRHARNPVSARLDPDDDRWFRQHVKQAGISIRQGVVTAIREYRSRHESTPPQEAPTEEKP